MNCQSVEKLILLEQSGEIAARYHSNLAGHLAACPSCRAYRADLARLTAALRQPAQANAASPAPAVLDRIRTAARTRQPAPPLIRWVHAQGWPVLAAAAALAVLLGLGGVLLLREHGAQGQAPLAKHQDRMTELAEIVAALLTPADTEPAAEQVSQATDIRDLARQLLILEGLEVEAFPTEDDEVTSDEEHLPTTLRWRSTPASPAA